MHTTSLYFHIAVQTPGHSCPCSMAYKTTFGHIYVPLLLGQVAFLFYIVNVCVCDFGLQKAPGLMVDIAIIYLHARRGMQQPTRAVGLSAC